jgi:GNAT superfamily N-acetyltransferase
MTPRDVEDACAHGLWANWRAQCAYIEGGEVAERGGLLVTATRLADETLNCAFVTRPLPDPDGTLRWCAGWFAERGMRMGVEVRTGEDPATEDWLARHAFTVVVRRPAMALWPLAVPHLPLPPRVAVTEVLGGADLAAFQAIQAEVFDMTPAVTEAFLPERAVATEGIRFFLARHDGVACATAATTLSEHGAGIVGVATLPAYRRRGLGRAVTSAAVAWGAARGAGLAWLFPSAMARPLYEGLGFTALREHAVWVAPDRH